MIVSHYILIHGLVLNGLMQCDDVQLRTRRALSLYKVYGDSIRLGFSADGLLLSPPNEVSEGNMKRAPYVCVCVRVSVRAKNVKVCFFSVISWPILILFVLSDRAWCGLQNFYTEFWNSLIMQIYANLFKINEKCYFSVISWPILILFVLSDRAWCGLQNFYTEFWNSLIMQFMQIYSKSTKNATSLFLGRFWFCLVYLIGLSGGFKTSTQNF